MNTNQKVFLPGSWDKSVAKHCRKAFEKLGSEIKALLDDANLEVRLVVAFVTELIANGFATMDDETARALTLFDESHSLGLEWETEEIFLKLRIFLSGLDGPSSVRVRERFSWHVDLETRAEGESDEEGNELDIDCQALIVIALCERANALQYDANSDHANFIVDRISKIEVWSDESAKFVGLKALELARPYVTPEGDGSQANQS